MSRLGKKPIAIPEKTEATVSGSTLTVKGPKGTLVKTFPDDVSIKSEGGELHFIPKKEESIQTNALWGTVSSHVQNMLEGVTKGYEKKLVIEGVGYRAELKGNNVSLLVGFSHPVLVAVPEGIKVAIEKGVITISGIDKDVLGQFAAEIRAVKKPEPYKGKGIRYEKEVIRRKQGKKSA